MLISSFSCKGLKSPSDRSSPKLIELLVRFKTELFADERISGDMGLFIPANVGTCGSQSCVSEESEDGE